MVGLVRILSLVLAIAASNISFAQSTRPATRPMNNDAVVIVIRGEITKLTQNALVEGVEAARELGVENIIIHMKTPGGLVDVGLEMTRFIKQQRDLHIIVFVEGYAYSAGTMIAIACNEIAMEPSAAIGDCAPISVSSGGQLAPLGPAERAKAESPILADFYESGTRNGYDPDLTAAFVVVGRELHWIEDEHGNRDFVDGATYRERTKGKWKPVEGVPNPVDSADTLLTVHTDLALQLGLAKEEVRSVQELAQRRGYNIVATFEQSYGEAAIAFLSNSFVQFILLVVFMQSLYASLHSPGHGFPEALALSSLGLLVGIPLLTGYAQWWEVAAILLGLVLIAVELFVLPGFGVTGITGIVLMIFGLLMTFVPVEPSMPGVLPSLAATTDALKQGLIVVTGGLLCSFLLWFWLNRYLPKMPYFNRLILAGNGGVGAGGAVVVPPPAEAPAFPAIGMTGKAVTDLRPGGTAEFHDAAIGDRRHVDVVSDSGFLRAGTPVVVREVSGSRVVVRSV